MSDDGERAAWEAFARRIGEDFAGEGVVWGADRIERGAIRRYVEVLEFDCLLHLDDDVAHAYGHEAPLLPATGILSWSVPPMRRPGERAIFTSNARNAEPERSPLKGVSPPGMPAFSAYFATDFEADYLAPVHVGDRLGRAGARLVACKPKNTKVGSGAFVTWEYDVVRHGCEVVARCRFTMFYYHPHPKGRA